MDVSRFFTYEKDEYETLKEKHPFDLEERFAHCTDKLGCIIKEVFCLQPHEFYAHWLGESQHFPWCKLPEHFYKCYQKALSCVDCLEIVGKTLLRLKFVCLLNNETSWASFPNPCFLVINLLKIDKIDCKGKMLKVKRVENGLQVGQFICKGEDWCLDGVGMELNNNGTFFLSNYKNGKRCGKCMYFSMDKISTYCLWEDMKYDGKHTTCFIHTGVEKVHHYSKGKWIKPKK